MINPVMVWSELIEHDNERVIKIALLVETMCLTRSNWHDV